MRTIEVVAGIVKKNNQFFCVQRDSSKHPYISYKFEFPGGKVQDDESLEEALQREIREELAIDIEINRFFMTVEHEYPDFYVRMHAFLCTTQSGSPSLNVHILGKWYNLEELPGLDWAAADIPIVEALIRNAK